MRPLALWHACVLIRLCYTQLTSEVRQSAAREISNSLWINLPVSQGSGYWPSVSLSVSRQTLSCLSVRFDWPALVLPSPDYCPSHSLLLPESHCSLLYLSHLISAIRSPPPLFFILHAFSLSFFILTPPSPPPAPFSSHTERCTNTIPHISNEYLVIILSPQRLSVWLRLSSDSVTNGTASFSTAAIPQHWQRCGAAPRTQLRGIVD